MQFSSITSVLNLWAPPFLAESYDNSGLIIGHPETHCKGILVALDCTESVLDEAIERGCNLVISHHPIWFTSRKKLNGDDYVSRTLIKAIKNDIGIFAIHTNLDNISRGVNQIISEKLGLQKTRILKVKEQSLMKLEVFVPHENRETLLLALWNAGAGKIGNYTQASFFVNGEGTFLPETGANPTIGKIGKLERVQESKVEVIFEKHLQTGLIRAMKDAHPYEEVAFQILALENGQPEMGAGMMGEFAKPLKKSDFLDLLKNTFSANGIRYSDCKQDEIKTVAVCGGSGSFLIFNALQEKADAFVSGEIGYHSFFEGDNRMLIADLGHWESEQFTSELICRFLSGKFPTFAVHLSKTVTNPVKYH